MPSAKQQSRGRITPSQRRAGRYTAPIPKDKRHSPTWYPVLLLALLLIGLILIILNYASLLPGGTKPYYLVAGIVCLCAGGLMSIQYR